MALDKFVKRPEEMILYLNNNSWHFNKKACEFAVSIMRKKNTATNKLEKIDFISKDQIEDMLTKNGIVLEKNKGYDFVFVFNMAKADFWKSSIEDERHLSLYVKDVIDDPDQEDGFIFRRWYSDTINSDIPIIWEDLI